MTFEQIVNNFLDANPRISRDERNLKLIVDYVLSKKLTITAESAPILLEAFVRENHDKILWLAEPKTETRKVPQNRRYNPAEELRAAAGQRAQQRENVKKNAELTGRRAEFEAEMRRIACWKEYRGAHVDWSSTFSTKVAKYEMLKKTYPQWHGECDAAIARVGK